MKKALKVRLTLLEEALGSSPDGGADAGHLAAGNVG